MRKVALYFKLLIVSIRSQMQYKSSFLMLAGAYFISTFVDIFGIWVLFDRFRLIDGWTFEELALIYGIMHMGFAVAEAGARGFDHFGLMVRSGDFDRILLRPVSSLMQIAARDIQLMRIGRFFQGLIILLWGCSRLAIPLASVDAAVLAMAFVGTACLFYGLFIMQATICFWTTDTVELMNVTTYGGLQAGQYPLSIYNRYFRTFFTAVIPLGCVAYYPLATMLRHEPLPLWLGGAVAPLAGIAFLTAACLLWKVGVRRYCSTGS